MKYKVLLKAIYNIIGIVDFTTLKASRAFSREPNFSEILSYDSDLANYHDKEFLNTKRLSNDLKRLHAMGFLRCTRRKRVIVAKTGKRFYRGYEYKYSLSLQGQGYIRHMQESWLFDGIISDSNEPAVAAIHANMTSDMQFNDHELAYLLKGYQPRKKQAKNPAFFTRYPKHDLQTVYDTLVDYNRGKSRNFSSRPLIDIEQLFFKVMPLIITALIKRANSSLKSEPVENSTEEQPIKLTLRKISDGNSMSKGAQNQSRDHPESGPYQSTSTPGRTPNDSASIKNNVGDPKSKSKAKEGIDLLRKLIHERNNSYKTKNVWPMVQIPHGIISGNKDPASKKKVEVRLDELVETIIDSLSKSPQNSLLTLAFLIPYAFAGQILPKSDQK